MSNCLVKCYIFLHNVNTVSNPYDFQECFEISESCVCLKFLKILNTLFHFLCVDIYNFKSINLIITKIYELNSRGISPLILFTPIFWSREQDLKKTHDLSTVKW